MLFNCVLKKIGSLAFVLSVILTVPLAAAADRVNTTSDTLLDRIQIEDMFYDYYWELGESDRSNIGKFWAEDAIFDMNGTIVNGQQAIQAIYNGDGRPPGNLTTLMGNPRIQVNGTTATVDVIYTGILSTVPDEAPKFFEQGHDHAELIKVEGQWMIQRRVLRNISNAASIE